MCRNRQVSPRGGSQWAYLRAQLEGGLECLNGVVELVHLRGGDDGAGHSLGVSYV